LIHVRQGEFHRRHDLKLSMLNEIAAKMVRKFTILDGDLAFFLRTQNDDGAKLATVVARADRNAAE